MKRVWVLRHAKAEQADEATADGERRLARRGRRDAAAIGRWLAEHGGSPDLIVSSPARRAMETARLVADACGFEGRIAEWPLLYPGEAAPTVEQIRELDDTLQSLVIVGHNPHAEQLVALLSGGSHVHMPTAAIALLEAEVERWRGLAAGAMQLAALVSPETL